MYLRLAVLFAAFLLVGSCASTPSASPAIASESFMVPSLDAGMELFVRNKRLAGSTTFPSNRILLMVHGAIAPSEAAFDIDLPGGSWMDYVAQRGFDVYIVDIRGFGGSTRPAAMDQPPEANEPFLDGPTAIRDISAAVDFIRKRTNADRINLLGWSWGTSVMGGYAAKNPHKVEKLVLFAPVWRETEPDPKPRGAYWMFTAIERPKSIPKERLEELFPMEWLNKVRAALLATDPVGAGRVPPGIRVPYPTLKEAQIWASGRATYEPGAIRAPTLVIVGEWDTVTPPELAQRLFSELSGAKQKRLVVMSEATHSPNMTNRMLLIRQVQHFLEEPAR